MTRRGRHSRGGGWVTAKRTRPLSSGGRPPAAGPAGLPAPGSSLSLIAEVRRAMRSGEPLDVLALVSRMLVAVDERGNDPLASLAPSSSPSTPRATDVSLDTLVRSVADVDGPETTALLAVIAELSGDELTRSRAERELAVRAGRLHRLPGWYRGLGGAAVTMAGEVVRGDGGAGSRNDLMFSVYMRPGHHLTVVVSVDHDLGTVVTDAYVVPEPVEVMIRRGDRPLDGPDTTWRAVKAADARARVVEAIEAGDTASPPIQSDNWRANRPLVEWVLRRAPEGGVGYKPRVWDARERGDLARRFLATVFGADHRTVDPDLLDAILWFGAEYGSGDPLRWSPALVEVLLTDWLPREVLLPEDELAPAPGVLRCLVWYSHTERDVPLDFVDELLAAVKTHEPAFRASIRSGVPDPREAILDALAEEVGGREALLGLDDAPLPDEEVRWEVVPGTVRARVRELAALCDSWCSAATGDAASEYRTACRRFLTAVAARQPSVFDRRWRRESAAAAVCWAVGTANHLFHTRSGGLRVKDLTAHFGVSGSPAVPGRTFLAAAGPLGGGYLVSSYRRTLVAQRDQCLTDDA